MEGSFGDAFSVTIQTLSEKAIIMEVRGVFQNLLRWFVGQVCLASKYDGKTD